MPSTPMPVEQMHSIALREASRYRHLSWINRDDAVHEALTEMMRAWHALTKNGTLTDNLLGYLSMTARYAIRAFVWSSTSPVKHTDRGTQPQQVSALRRTEVDDSSMRELDLPVDQQDEALHVARWRFAVQVRFTQLTNDDPEIDRIIAWRVLLEDEDSEQVAADEEVTVRAVYVVTQRIRNRILKDVEMRSLLSER